MPESTTSQSSQEVFDSMAGDQWSQENRPNVPKTETNLEWNALTNHNINPVAPNITNQAFNPNTANSNVPMVYNTPQHYVNINNSQQYQRHAQIHNGYPRIIPNSQHMSPAPVMLRPHQRPQAPPLPNTWTTQQNIKLIQTAWNKPSYGGVKKQKRVRTAFTSQQMMELEQEYSRTRYLDRTRRIELADTLRLNERTIKIWFQNRRMKEKKDRAENLEEVENVSTTQSSELEVPMYHEQYQANTEAFNRMGVFVEQYPVSSTSMSPMPQALMPPTYPYALQEESAAQYQQVHFQVQQYPSPYCEVQELSPESVPQSESSASVDTQAPSNITEKNWDLSWIKSLEAEEE